MATFTVTDTADSGPGTLRQAMIDAAANPGPDTINFTVMGRITLLTQLPPVIDELTIDGPGAAALTVSGGNQCRLFQVNHPGRLTLQRLTLADGNGKDPDFSTRLGGAIISQGTVHLIDSVIQDCDDELNGGAINSQPGATLSVVGCLLRRNRSGFGGAIFTWGGTSIADSVFSENSATLGGVFFNEGALTVSGSTLSANTAAGHGGAIFAVGGTKLVNVTLSGNRAPQGGAIHAEATVDGSFITIAETVVTSEPGGAVESIAPGRVQLLNTIIAGTTDGADQPRPHCVGAVTNAGGSFATLPTCPGFKGATPALLKLGPLQVNPPGQTPTHALQPGSWAIDTAVGCTDLAGQPVTTDQRGVARPQGPACDVGAYEAPYVPPLPPPPPPPRWPLLPPGAVPPACGRRLCPPGDCRE